MIIKLPKRDDNLYYPLKVMVFPNAEIAYLIVNDNFFPDAKPASGGYYIVIKCYINCLGVNQTTDRNKTAVDNTLSNYEQLRNDKNNTYIEYQYTARGDAIIRCHPDSLKDGNIKYFYIDTTFQDSLGTLSRKPLESNIVSDITDVPFQNQFAPPPQPSLIGCAIL